MIKKIFAILLVLICALSISTVSAADTSADDSFAFTKLNGTITAATEGATVELTDDYKYNSNVDNGPINIDKDLTIDGKGHTIDASGKVSVFNITKGNVIIKDITFINGNSTTGGAINNNGNLTLINCNFINNTADAKGGAVYNTKILTVDNCVFDGNDIAIRNIGGNSAYGGAAIYSIEDTTTNIMNSEIKNSIKNFKPVREDVLTAAISVNDNLTVTNCKFTNNSGRYGGAIIVANDNKNKNFTAIIKDSAFNDNHALFGGAINGQKDNVLVIVSNCNFTNNKGFGKGDVPQDNNGGAIAIYNKAQAYIENCKFINNSGQYGGTIYAYDDNGVTISDCSFINNSAQYGGAIVIPGIIGGQDVNSVVNISNCNFTGNKASESSGAIFIYNNATASIENSNFINNSAKKNGGAIEARDNTGVTISSCSFINNSAKKNGGAILTAFYNDDCINNVTIYDCSFINNSAVSQGGAIYNNMHATINNSVFDNNNARKGADIECYMGWSDGDNTVSISLNNITSDGKGIYISSKSIATNITDTILATEIKLNKVKNVTIGDNVTISGKVTIVGYKYSKINGTLAITIDGNKDILVNVTDSVFTVDIENMSAGTYNATLVFTGKDYISSNATVKFTVNKIATNIAIDDLNIFVGENATILGNITGIPENATIVINVDGENYTVVVNGTNLSVTVKDLAVGSYNVTATYEGNDKYEAASANATVTVSKYPTVTTIVNITDVLNAGDRLLINATLTSQNKPVNGTVELYINGKLVTKEEAVDGKVSFNATPYAGKVTVMVKFAGDDKYEGSNATQDISVNGTEASLTVPDVTLFFKNGTKLLVYLTANGTNVSNETVIININGIDYTRTIKNGTAGISINLAPGTYNVTVTLFSEKYNFASTNATLTVLPVIEGNDTVLFFKNGTKYVALFLDGQGKPLEGANIQFNINGRLYNRTTNANGTASIAINLAPGEYIITAVNLGNGAVHSNNITVLPTIISENIVKYYKNETQYVVKVLDGKGNALANQTVEYNINGVFYKRTTNANGTAVFNINLAAGNCEPKDYIITASCNGYAVSNNVTVLPVLTAEDFNETFKAGKKFTAKIVDGQGKPLEGAKIQFNINGVFYNRTSDVNGTVGLNINLAPGEYIITSVCKDNGAVISNKVTVTPKV